MTNILRGKSEMDW